MKEADTKTIANTETVTKLSKLETLFNSKISLINQNNSQFTGTVRATLNAISNTPKHKPVTLLITTDSQQHAIKKLWFFLQSFLQFNYLKYRIARIPDITMISYGVYPHIENPFAIYQLNSSAEIYANENILPAINAGAKGRGLQALKLLVRHHPSTAGIVISIHKKS